MSGVFARLDDTEPPAANCHHCGSSRRQPGPGVLYECVRCGHNWLRQSPEVRPDTPHVTRALNAAAPPPQLRLVRDTKPETRS